MQEIHIGLVAIARTTFDMALAQEVTAQARTQLTAAGLTLVGSDALVTSTEEAETAIDALANDPPDLLILLQATFADSTITLKLASEINAPLLLWAVPEEHTGGRLRLNSLCGVNLAAHGLRRLGHPYEYVYGAPDDPAVIEKILTVAKAGRVRSLLRRARIGRVGEHPAGFDTCKVDVEKVARQLGIEVVQMDLQNDIFARARTANSDAVEMTLDALGQRVGGLDQLDSKATQGTISAYLTLREWAKAEKLNGYAVRCWPEFFTEMGCAACGAMSMLSDEQTPCSCEADVNGTITQLMLQGLSGEPAFGADIVSVDNERDGLVLWHCGLAPLSMVDPQAQPAGTIHSNRKLPLLMEFPLKPGHVTLARLSEATGEYRLIIGKGEMLRAPRSFSGTTGIVRFDRPAETVLDTILTEGLEHHISLTYGDHVAALTALGKMLQLPMLFL
ncbi:MAG: L-fucose/L-arabinose isomerase family protein [Anaerolineae bacterium]|nr:L-fucose/L-arabinose isomerase family protein [Anaerolineae bacterium]